jgi:glycine/D-amino acid oxidase-like deaminating enzyme
MCALIIARLEAANVLFRWRTRIDTDTSGDIALPAGDFVWAAGASTATSRFLRDASVLLQGVAGCWAAIPNPGFAQAFKLLAPEPVNFINATPTNTALLLSGGYGWVGERNYGEAARYIRPLREIFAETVSRFFLNGPRDALVGCPTAMCVRPSLPTGVPIVRLLCERRSGVICVGHAAGGFTQAPEMARLVIEELE